MIQSLSYASTAPPLAANASLNASSSRAAAALCAYNAPAASTVVTLSHVGRAISKADWQMTACSGELENTIDKKELAIKQPFVEECMDELNRVTRRLWGVDAKTVFILYAAMGAAAGVACATSRGVPPAIGVGDPRSAA